MIFLLAIRSQSFHAQSHSSYRRDSHRLSWSCQLPHSRLSTKSCTHAATCAGQAACPWLSAVSRSSRHRVTLYPGSQHWEDGEEAGGQCEAGNMPLVFFFPHSQGMCVQPCDYRWVLDVSHTSGHSLHVDLPSGMMIGDAGRTAVYGLHQTPGAHQPVPACLRASKQSG